MKNDKKYINRCLKLADHSLKNGDYYFGSLITHNDKIIIEANNTVQQDITGHAEINAIRKLKDEHPNIKPTECTLYSSFEPCGMCSFLIRDIGIGRVVFSAPSPYMGGYTRWDILTTDNLDDKFTLNGAGKPPKITPYVLEKKSTKILDSLNWEMHRCPNLTDDETKTTITNIASNIKCIGEDSVLDIFKSYYSIPSENRHVAYLRDRLKSLYPNLFEKNVRNISLDTYTKFAAKTISTDDSSHIKDPVILHAELENIRQYMINLFPETDNIHTFRVSSVEEIAKKLEQNGARGTLDNIGYRIVPKNTKSFSNMIYKFEKDFKHNIKYKLNTFALTDDEFYSILSKSSSLSYRAIHYYVQIGSCIIEIQFRTSATDTWASIHHETIYKPKVQISREEKQAIDKFGVIANIVDYNRIIGLVD